MIGLRPGNKGRVPTITPSQVLSAADQPQDHHELYCADLLKLCALQATGKPAAANRVPMVDHIEVFGQEGQSGLPKSKD